LLLAGQTSTVTFTFSEAVSNFVLGDTTVTGGALSNLVHVGLNGSNQDVYTATFTPGVTNTEAGSVQVNAASYADLAGNSGAASNTVNFSGDTLAPTVSIAANHTALLAGQTAAVTFIFSEAVAFALGDTTVTGGSLSNLVHVGLNGSHQDIYTATFTPDAVNNEAGSVEVNVASYTDLAGNTGASSNTLDFSGDTLAPTATAVASPSIGVEGVGDIVKMTLSFGEAVRIGGATPELTLNDGGHAIYDATATAALNNPDKLVFDYTVGPTDATVASLAITGITAGTTITDLAGNNASVAASFAGLQVISSVLTANPDSNHVTANQAVSADAAHGVLANDTDTNPTDQLFISAVDGLAGDVNQPIAGSYGTLTLHADGSYTYIANNMSVGVGVDNFVYTMSDGHGQTSTSTLAITVTGDNETYTQVAAGGSAASGVGNAVLDGSAGNATLTAAATLNAHPVLIGGPNDTLNAASFGQDTFVFNNNFGHEIVNNFQPALDVIQLQQSQFGSLANVLADIQQVGADSVLALDTNHVITLTNIQHTSLTAADFHLV
jgi:VCBS repeat-containing protein